MEENENVDPVSPPKRKKSRRKENPRRPGRKLLTWDEETIQRAVDGVSIGWLSMNELAVYMGISKSTLYELLDRNPEIRKRLDKARVEQKALMVTRMTQLALEGNVQALRWKLSVCHGLSEKTRVTVETRDPIAAKVANMTKDELAQRAAELTLKMKTKGEKK